MKIQEVENKMTEEDRQYIQDLTNEIKKWVVSHDSWPKDNGFTDDDWGDYDDWDSEGSDWSAGGWHVDDDGRLVYEEVNIPGNNVEAVILRDEGLYFYNDYSRNKYLNSLLHEAYWEYNSMNKIVEFYIELGLPSGIESTI